MRVVFGRDEIVTRGLLPSSLIVELEREPKPDLAHLFSEDQQLVRPF